MKRYGLIRCGSGSWAEVEPDNRCELGQWIYGEGQSRHSASPEFATLKVQHARFHSAAAVVLRRIEARTYTSEEASLGGSSPYSEASGACVSALMAMKRKAAT